MNHDEAFSPQERAALALWAVPSPPLDFAERVLARAALSADPLGSEKFSGGRPRGSSAWGGFAAAAVCALLLGGLWSWHGLARSGGGEAVDPETPAGQRSLGSVPNDHDAGPRPEVGEVQPSDGIQAQAS